MKTGDICIYATGCLLFAFEVEDIRNVTTNGVTEAYVIAVPGTVVSLWRGGAEVVKDSNNYFSYYDCRLANINERLLWEKSSSV